VVEVWKLYEEISTNRIYGDCIEACKVLTDGVLRVHKLAAGTEKAALDLQLVKY
jgi:hypothetical protein